jgi:hypothetical protein
MERKRRIGTQSNRPRGSDPKDLVAKRRKLLESYFENGRQIAGELVQEIEGARKRLQELENDNARLRMQLKSDAAIRELLNKIESLESERMALLSRSEEVERKARNELERAMAVESELSNLASLYVASSQLHASMEPREVIQTMGQLLLQFVGAGAYVIYTADGTKLVPIASEGVALDDVRPERVGEGVVGSSFLAQDVVVTTNGTRQRGVPIATVPLRVGDEAVGAVAVFELLEQKGELGDADYELLRMLGTQGATALAGARLFAASGGAIPRLSEGASQLADEML